MRRLNMVLAFGLIWAFGCAGRGGPKAPDAGAAPPPEAPPPATRATGDLSLTWEKLRNAAFPLPEANGNLIQFTEGKFKGPVVLGSSDEVRFIIQERIARGDLDGDGVDDAALVMVKDPLGDSPAYTLWAVINLGGVPDPRGFVPLGEKIQVGGMSIDALKIYVDVVRPGPQDIQGIPTQRIKESYKLIGNRLERADLFR